MNISALRCLLTLLVVTLLFLPADSWAMAGTPGVVLPEGALSAEQIRSLFSDRSVAAKSRENGHETYYYFAEGGQVIEAHNGWQQTGLWTVREDGRLCIDLEGDNRDCRMIVKEGGKYSQYAVKQDGNHRFELSYFDFRNGNQLAGMSLDPVLPIGTLSSQEVIELFSGKTVESVTAQQGRVSQTYYDPDGSLVQFRNGVKRTGKWRVTGSARICLQMEDLEEKCRIIVKDGRDYKKYIVKTNGEHQHSVSYRRFVPGKQF